MSDIHRLTLDAAVAEFLRTHRDGARLLLQYMASVPADPTVASPANDHSLSARCLEQFHRQRAGAIRRVKES